jgi:hypothetical protein
VEVPNWYTTKIEVKGKEADIKAFVARHFPNGVFGFETIIPMPEVYRHITAGSEVQNGVKALQGTPVQAWAFIAKHRGTKTLGEAKMSIQAKAEYGYANGYEWCNDNWGTKWDACNVEIDRQVHFDLHFRFDTAWGPAEPVYAKMREMWPNLEFDIMGHGEEDYETDDDGDLGEPIWHSL